MLGLFRIDKRGDRHVMVGYSDEAMEAVLEDALRGARMSTERPRSSENKGGKLLIVEGRDEQFFFDAALRDHLGLTDIQVMPIGGKTRLTADSKSWSMTILFPNGCSLSQWSGTPIPRR